MKIIGAYAAAGSGQTKPDLAWLGEKCLALSGVTGLELPFTGAESPWLQQSLVARFAESAPDAQHVITLLPALVRATRVDETTGLASMNSPGRRRAIDLVERARELVQTLNEAVPGSVAKVAVHSSPQRPWSAPDALAESLSELTDRDWSGARIVVEHCDAWSSDHRPEKGYLSLTEEIAAVVAAGQLRIEGLVVNWGRSAIETRSPDGALQHLAELSQHSLPTGLMFSGAAPVETAYGQAWGDVHVPLAEFGAEEPSAAHSLMTAAEVRACLEATDDTPLLYNGVKVSAPPLADDHARLRVIASALDALRR